MKPIIEHLFNHIETEMPELQGVAIWNRQPENMKEEDPLIAPYVYVHLLSSDAQWSGMGAKSQQGEFVIGFYLMTANFVNYSTDAYSSNDFDPLEYLVLLEKLHYVLQNHGWTETGPPTNGSYGFSALARVGQSEDIDHGAIRLDKLFYQTQVEDRSVERKQELEDYVEYINVTGTDVGG